MSYTKQGDGEGSSIMRNKVLTELKGNNGAGPQ